MVVLKDLIGLLSILIMHNILSDNYYNDVDVCNVMQFREFLFLSNATRLRPTDNVWTTIRRVATTGVFVETDFSA